MMELMLMVQVSDTVMTLLCGNWGSKECTAKRWSVFSFSVGLQGIFSRKFVKITSFSGFLTDF
jgi:hypothetical protein